MIADIINFDTYAQYGQPLRLLTWISFIRLRERITEVLEFYLPRAVATKFITAVMIDPENHMEEFNDQNPEPNIDVNSILMSGFMLELPDELANIKSEPKKPEAEDPSNLNEPNNTPVK